MLVSAWKFDVLLTIVAISYVTSKVIPDYDLDNEISDHSSVASKLEDNGEGSYECKIYDCDSQIFCNGSILHDVQMNRIYPDSKSFVDAKLRFSEAEIIKNYTELKEQSILANISKLSVGQIEGFVNDNFYHPEDPEHMGLDRWSPPDFNNTPSILENITDVQYKQFARELNQIWKTLAVKVSLDVQNNSQYSLIYVPNGFIKAGGRFREMYYWDTYWIIRGLLICDMNDTVRGIIENMIFLVKQFGFVPNGSRKYYLRRSQPPLLIQMADAYYFKTKDYSFIKRNLQYFDDEFQFWIKNRTVNVNKGDRNYTMFRYNAESCSPRPESYREDYENAQKIKNTADQNRFYTGIRSGAESGWDFSSRHIRAHDNSNGVSLQDIQTQNFVYVDLNSIMHANAVLLSKWYRKCKNNAKANEYKTLAKNLQEAIDNVLWNETAGIWQDWDLITGKSRSYNFYASNLTPLWTGSYNQSESDKFAVKAILYLVKNEVIHSNLSAKYWGVPISMKNGSEQQWDYPNAWSPLQAIVTQGLERTRHPGAGHVAFNLAKNWLITTHNSYSMNNFVMYEKYHAVKKAERGSGGEYQVQTGFGWTNGYIFEILETYGQILDSTPA